VDLWACPVDGNYVRIVQHERGQDVLPSTGESSLDLLAKLGKENLITFLLLLTILHVEVVSL
jgi:hypothetical protein